MLTLSFFYFDPMYFIILAPALLLALWAQFRVKSAYGQASQIAVLSGISGAETCEMILQANNVSNIRIEEGHGVLSDHYDPKHKVVRLSPEVYHGRTAAALGIAAHECGHVMQEKSGYAPLAIRNGIVPIAAFGGPFAGLIFMLGFAFSQGRGGSTIGDVMMFGAIAIFTVVVAFQLINLPVEFDASKCAKQWLSTSGLVSPQEEPYVRKVLNAAAWTYVAATLAAILTLAYYILRASSARRD